MVVSKLDVVSRCQGPWAAEAIVQGVAGFWVDVSSGESLGVLPRKLAKIAFCEAAGLPGCALHHRGREEDLSRFADDITTSVCPHSRSCMLLSFLRFAPALDLAFLPARRRSASRRRPPGGQAEQQVRPLQLFFLPFEDRVSLIDLALTELESDPFHSSPRPPIPHRFFSCCTLT